MILIASTFASVYASGGYSPTQPLLGTTGGAPALTGAAYTGVLTVLYADGSPVVLESDKVTLQLCASSCISQEVTLKQTAPGTYAYSFTPPSSLTGTITITVDAGSLADDNGRIFPSVNTQVGTYATPSLTGQATQPALPAYPVAQQSMNGNEAVALPQSAQESPAVIVVTIIGVLVTAGALLILPRRR